MSGADAKLGGKDALLRPPPGSMMLELPQPAGLSDQERMANLIRQCMAPLPTVGFFSCVIALACGNALHASLCLQSAHMGVC